jgi:hypothetical protein
MVRCGLRQRKRGVARLQFRRKEWTQGGSEPGGLRLGGSELGGSG